MPPVDEQRIHDAVELEKAGMKRRAIARALHMGRNTVRHVLEEHREARRSPHSALAPPGQGARRPSKLDAFRPRVEALLRTYADITAQRVFEILRDEGYPGGDTIVKDLVRRVRPKKPPEPSLETAPRVPGDMAECDWSPFEVPFTHAPRETLQAFGYVLRYSTRKYFDFFRGNGLHPLMDGHVRAFERFQGAALHCKYDSQKPVVLRWEGAQPVYNPRFVDFATHYEFRPVACRRRKPNDKPRVERSFYELLLSFFKGRTLRDFDDLKAQLRHWLDTTCDLRPIKRMRRRTRLELFAEEQPLLRPLPRHPYDTARVLYRLCDIEGFVAWEGNWYSLPYDHVTELLPVRVTDNELFVYAPDLTCLARHELRPRGAQERSILPGHRPARAERGPDLDQLRRAFRDMGGCGAEYLAALERREPRSAGHHARKVLALREGYDTADLLRALSHALAYAALEHDCVERILAARGDRRRLDEYVAEACAKKLSAAVAGSSTEPRDLAEYDALPCGAGPRRPEGDTPCRSEADPTCEARPPEPGSASSDTSSGSA